MIFLKKLNSQMSYFLKKIFTNLRKDLLKLILLLTKKTVGEIVEIGVEKKSRLLDNKLILITNADPGYDFIFNYKIKGLVTMYGGSNSHMAIRCLEQNIPML